MKVLAGMLLHNEFQWHFSLWPVSKTLAVNQMTQGWLTGKAPVRYLCKRLRKNRKAWEGSSRLFAYLRQEHHGIGGNLESSKRQHGHRTQHLVLLSKEKHRVVGHRSCNRKALGCWQTATNKKLLSYTHISRYLTIIHHVSSEFWCDLRQPMSNNGWLQFSGLLHALSTQEGQSPPTTTAARLR